MKQIIQIRKDYWGVPWMNNSWGFSSETCASSGTIWSEYEFIYDHEGD